MSLKDSGLILLSESLKREALRRICDESIHRIYICLHKLTEQQIWHKPNEHSNSVGHLVLHLCGNARQWIGTGIGGGEDTRKRNWEFTTDEKFSKDRLIEMLGTLDGELRQTVESISPEDWTQIRKVQVFEESVLSILVHVVEHFSYHTGQITLLTKLYINEDLKYYGDLNLEVQ
ncbi:MAG: DUF1572 family protein [Saprospiraceae bacterium]|nr:DUF1572 family protein [Saprospiraceae bacterium]